MKALKNIEPFLTLDINVLFHFKCRRGICNIVDCQWVRVPKGYRFGGRFTRSRPRDLTFEIAFKIFILEFRILFYDYIVFYH